MKGYMIRDVYALLEEVRGYDWIVTNVDCTAFVVDKNDIAPEDRDIFAKYSDEVDIEVLPYRMEILQYRRLMDKRFWASRILNKTVVIKGE